MNNTSKDPLEVLRSFNEWRCGAEVAPPSQREIGLAIHAVIDELETLRKKTNTSKIMSEQIGSFEINLEFIEKYPELVRAIMRCCIILRAELMYHNKSIEYVATSPEFDEISEGEFIPRYMIDISDDGAHVKVSRIKTTQWENRDENNLGDKCQLKRCVSSELKR
jgi:hypothetical protein